MKKLVRAVRRLLIAGLVGGGALFAAVKVGPKVTPRIRSLLHRTPPDEDLPDHHDHADPGAAGASEPHVPGPAAESSQAGTNPETSSHEDASE